MTPSAKALRRLAAWAAGAFAAGGVLPALGGCDAKPPASQADVVRALVRDFAPPLRNALFVGGTSDCRSDGVTNAPLEADAFGAFLTANVGAPALDLTPWADRLRLDASGALPNVLAAREGRPVVALSRPGLAGDVALLCAEVYSTDKRGYLLRFVRDHAGEWALRAEFEVWREDAQRVEELPSGEVLNKRAASRSTSDGA